jgi:hypothetical protein
VFRPAFKPGPLPTGSEASQSADENPPNLKMAERPDWTLFRTIEGLAQKAGVPPRALRRLALKELADNALDSGGNVEAGGDGELGPRPQLDQRWRGRLRR